MNLSISRSRESFLAWLFWGLGLYLVWEASIFFLVGWALKRTAGELVGPYVAWAVPGVILISPVWWLRRQEERGTAPKRLARRWGLTLAFSIVALSGALSYSGVKLRFESRMMAVESGIVSALLGFFVGYVSVYRRVLARILSRPGRSGG